MSTAFALIFGVMGALLGSFANVCIYRLPREQSIIWPPSHCPQCTEKIRPWQLVPVLSWLALGGKCAMCRRPIPWRYPLVELSTMLVFAWIGYRWGLSMEAVSYAVLAWALIVAVGTDFSHRIIPDSISLGAAGVLAVLALLRLDWGALLGGMLLFAILFLIAVASRGGMGGGDIKLALAIGLALGWQTGLVALVLAVFVGGLMSVGLMVFRRVGMKTELPFGPFLALGALVAMFWAPVLIDGYWNLTLLLWRW